MARKTLWTIIGLGTLLVAGACGDDDGGGVDQGGGDAFLVDGHGSPEGSPPGDAGTTPRDTGTKPGDAGAGKDVALATKNSGAICSSSQPCPNASEECIIFDSTLGKGMCLDACAAQGDPCPVPDSSSQISFCATTGYKPGTWYCAWFCELNGKAYSCPNGTDYTCVASSSGGATFCRPK